MYKDIKRVSNFNYQKLLETFKSKTTTTTLDEIKRIPDNMFSSDLLNNIIKNCDDNVIIFLDNKSLLEERELKQIYLERELDVPKELGIDHKLYSERVKESHLKNLILDPSRISVDDLTRDIIINNISFFEKSPIHIERCFKILIEGDITEHFFCIADQFDWDKKEISKRVTTPISIPGSYICEEFLNNENISFISRPSEDFNKENVFKKLLDENRINQFNCVFEGSNAPLNVLLKVSTFDFIMKLPSQRVIKYRNSYLIIQYYIEQSGNLQL